MSDNRSAAVAIRRFGLGAREGDLSTLAADPIGQLLAEFHRPATLTDGAGIGSTSDVLASIRAARPAMKGLVDTVAAGATPITPRKPLDIYREEIAARLHQAAEARIGFAERLVAFWANHFAVSGSRSGQLRAAAGSFEREAIRPHIAGRFVDMLLAVETHPAMLLYLDNASSIGPNSRAGGRRGRGLNENLGREIMELHTLGVDGGYTQTDVTTFAKILTGWTIAPPDGRLGPYGTSVFNPNLHEPGSQKVLGKVYPDTGPDQARSVLRDLARHPATARYISFKLARHFISDHPPKTVVARLAKVFGDTDGDLSAVTESLVHSPEAWTAEALKIRSPHEFVLASARILGLDLGVPLYTHAVAMLGEQIWAPPGPNGYPDTVEQWVSPEGLKTRLELAARFAAQTRISDPVKSVDEALGPLASKRTRETVARAGDKQQAVALLLMSPEFQRR